MNGTEWLSPEAILVGDGSEPLAETSVAIRDGRIVDLRPTAALDLESRRASRRLPGATLTPGFIDAHVHLLFSCDTDHERTRARFVEAPDADLATVGSRNLIECLLGGVTTVRDLGDTRWIVRTLRDAVARGTHPGPRILTAGAPVTTASGHLNWCGNVATSEDELADAVGSILNGGADVVKIMSSGGSMTRESDPFSAQFTLRALREAVELAHAAGVRVAAHSQNAEAIRRCIAAGVDTLEHCLWREPDGTPAATSDLIDELRRGSSSVVLTLAGIQRALVPGAQGFTPDEHTAARASSRTGSLEDDLAWARELRDAGIPLVVASDAGVRFTPFRHFVDTLRAAQLGLHLTPSEAVHSATGLAAQALGIDHEVGRVVPGLRADLVLLEGADADVTLGDVAGVYIAGEHVVAGDTLRYPRPPR